MLVHALLLAAILLSPPALPLGGGATIAPAEASIVAPKGTHAKPRRREAAIPRAAGAQTKLRHTNEPLPPFHRVSSVFLRAFASSRETLLISKPKPRRIVSTNVCADQLALALVARARIASVSRLAIEPQISNFAEAAEGIPVNNARAEEIVELKPDLVLGDIYTGQHANRLSQSLGVPVHVIGAVASIDDVRKIVRGVADAVGESERGAAMIAAMDARIAGVQRLPGAPVSALVYEPNGVSSGNGTLTHDVLKAAGLKNLAPELMPGSYGTVPLELVIASAPRLLILDDAYTGTSSRAQSILRHPAFRSLEGKSALYAMPSRLWICPGPWIAEAVERLAAERARLAPQAKREYPTRQ